MATGQELIEQCKQGSPVLVLLSGGIDSTACVDFYLSQQCPVRAIFFDYGQLGARRERQAAVGVCGHYAVDLAVVRCAGMVRKGAGVILGRNAFLLYAALMEFDAPSGLIATGIHDGTYYRDCSQEFVKAIQSNFDAYTDGCVHISTPFLTWSKGNIWHYCVERHVPVHLTYSCELGRDQPCGECLSCRDLEALHVHT